ncbi:class I glutamine amidotransferase-like protein [Cyathus striatus]|nr:class I glutamine amidotransferase-like protein [Cyathus striatus]
MTSTVLSIGVLLLPEFQLLDAMVPFAHKGPSIKWHYISSTADLTPMNALSGPLLVPTCTYADCPPLDYLLVPGPEPKNPLPAGCDEFLKTKLKEIKLLLLVCTGSLAIARTGILDGLQVCGNKCLLKAMKADGTLRKEVKWVGDRRWIKDGKVWSAGGVTAGIDLAAEFARVHFDPEVVELRGCSLSMSPTLTSLTFSARF